MTLHTYAAGRCFCQLRQPDHEDVEHGPRRRRLLIDPKAALRRAGRWTLVGVVLGFALIGFLQVTRGTAVRHVQGVGTGGASVGVSEHEFPLMVSMLAGTVLAPGHRVEGPPEW
jgi:hypothetical protein